MLYISEMRGVLESEKSSGHSAGRDYSIQYGKNSEASEDHTGGQFEKGKGKKQGLIERRPL